jgi:hypothetical protein
MLNQTSKKQVANVIFISLAIFFVGASVASSKIKTLKKIGAGSITNPYIGDNAVNSAKIQDGTVSGSDLADNSVTTGKIEDGTIANADISGSAGITGTKVSPNFGGQNILTTGTGTFGSIWANTLDAKDASTPLYIGSTYPGDNSYLNLYPTTFTDGSVFVGNSLYLTQSSASADSATSSTEPSETCSSILEGRVEYVDDTNAAGVYLWICEQTGSSSYGWYRIQ